MRIKARVLARTTTNRDTAIRQVGGKRAGRSHTCRDAGIIKPGVATLLVLLFVLPLVSVPARPALAAGVADTIRAEAFILMDADTGQILLEKNMHMQLKPASITKIMTALLALEHGGPTDPVTVSAEAVAANPGDGSSAGLMPGEIIPLDEILYAVMLESANEAANAVAEFVSGSMENFAALMTRRAKELGAKDTHFANANGLNDDAHYTSAYDMALITREAIRSERFLRIWGTYQHTLAPTNLQPESRMLNNKNRMLPQGSMPYDGILGGKTGYTVASLNTLVEAARRDGRTLICIFLHAPGALANFQDAVKLLDYGFDQFDAVTYEDAEYEDSFSYLLHHDLTSAQVEISYGEPVDNEDGSHSVSVDVRTPRDSGDLMYPDIGAEMLTSPAPPPPEPEPTPEATVGLAAQIRSVPPVRWLVGLLDHIDRLPGWLAFLVKAILSLFVALFALACFFRTRRWLRRRRRIILRRRMQTRQKTYRQQSFWG